jgi:signal transduction histidine kinase
VVLAVVGEAWPLPPGLDLTVFRIVQEALTNTLKHAGPVASAEVTLHYRPGSIDIEVLDDGTARPAPPAGGHGLIGMVERVSVFGGSIDTGHRPEGGFRVSVTLPVEGR